MIRASSLKEAVVEALNAMGRSGSISEVKVFINAKYPGKWKDIGTVMADLCPESLSSQYSQLDRVLERVGRGKYRLRKTKLTNKLPNPIFKKSENTLDSLNVMSFSLKGAQEILQKKGQLSTILQAASLTKLSSKDDHNKIQHFLHGKKWDVEVSVFPVIGYRLDAFKEKTGLEIERSLIDAVHRSLFRSQWAYSKKQLDVLVFIVPTYKEPKFIHVKRDIENFKDIIPYPVFVVGINP